MSAFPSPFDDIGFTGDTFVSCSRVLSKFASPWEVIVNLLQSEVRYVREEQKYRDPDHRRDREQLCSVDVKRGSGNLGRTERALSRIYCHENYQPVLSVKQLWSTAYPDDVLRPKSFREPLCIQSQRTGEEELLPSSDKDHDKFADFKVVALHALSFKCHFLPPPSA